MPVLILSTEILQIKKIHDVRYIEASLNDTGSQIFFFIVPSRDATTYLIPFLL